MLYIKKLVNNKMLKKIFFKKFLQIFILNKIIKILKNKGFLLDGTGCFHYNRNDIF